MRKYPGVPELAGRGMPGIVDQVAIYRARWAGHSPADVLRLFPLGAGWSWRAFSVPGVANQAMPSRGTFEDQISLTPGSLLLGISSVSDQPEGFRFLITDRGTGQTLANDYCQHGAESGTSGARFPGRGGPLYLGTPWTISDAGLLMVQITNLSAVVNSLNLCLQFAERTR